MCIILLNLSHPDFLFVCGANRDEFLARPAAASRWHDFPPPSDYTTDGSPSPSLALRKRQADAIMHVSANGSDKAIGQDDAGPSKARPVLSGLDAHPSGGGTWIGITADGRFGALTNYTEYERPPLPEGRGLTDFRSRGSLVKDWLINSKSSSAQDDLETYLTGIDEHSDEWPGFNVLAGYLIDEHGHFAPRIGYVTNRESKGPGRQYIWPDDGTPSKTICADDDVTHESSQRSTGLSNSTYDTPWSKVKSGQAALDDALRRYDENKERDGRDEAEAKLARDIFDILATPTGVIARREDLRQTVLVTPLKMPSGLWYATRVATVLLVRRPEETDKTLSAQEAPAQWWERDICVLDAKGENPIRCGPEHQRHYSFTLSSQADV